jgi:hypothetical protein
MNSRDQKFIFIIKLALILMLLGRAWQHFFWGTPYRIIIWNESLLSPLFTNFFQITWQDWATSTTVNNSLKFFNQFLGMFYLMMSLLVFKINKNFHKLKYFLPLTSISLFVLSFLYYMEKFFMTGMLIEFASQFSLPMILYFAIFKENFYSRFNLFFKFVVALTFLGHGLFAVGFHPVPGPFIDMVISVFQVSETWARNFLLFMGLIDIFVCVLIFIPDFEIIVLRFATFWGLTTAMARIVAHINIELAAMTLNQWIMEVLTRLPHGLLPLAMLLYIKTKKVPLEKV